MPLTRGWTVMLHVCRIWVSIAMVAKMIYQLSIIDKEYWNSNCTVRLNFLFVMWNCTVRLNFLFVMWNRLYQAAIKDKMLPTKLNVLFTHIIVIHFTNKTVSFIIRKAQKSITYTKHSLHFTHETKWLRITLLNWMCESELFSIKKRNWYFVLFFYKQISLDQIVQYIKRQIYM